MRSVDQIKTEKANQKVKCILRVQFLYCGLLNSVTGEWETDILPGETEEEATQRANARALTVALSLQDMYVARMEQIKKTKEK